MSRAFENKRCVQKWTSRSGLKSAVVMTGAMTPLGFEGSDGLQNLAEALMAAKLLGIGKTTLYRKLKEYGITEDLGD